LSRFLAKLLLAVTTTVIHIFAALPIKIALILTIGVAIAAIKTKVITPIADSYVAGRFCIRRKTASKYNHHRQDKTNE
jgi:hypothetical protein